MEPSSWRWPGALSGRHVAVLLLLGCATRSRVCDATAPVATYEVVKKYPHESGCFTEGFSVNHTEGIAPEVFESCGLTGRSYVRRYDLESGQTKQRVGLEAKYFGEGAVLLGDSLLVLTYQHHEMLEMDAKTLQVLRTHPFPYGEGWGLTTDGCDLLATTGSSYLFRLRRSTTNGLFELANKVQVTHEGRPLRMLNEIEYITPKLWVNEWITNRIWRVDPLTGHCEMQIDIGKLHKWRGQATPNGIAYSPSLGADLLLVTGKLWPLIFSLRFKVTDLCGGQTQSVTCPSAPPSACWHNTNPLTVPTPVVPLAPLAPVAPTAKPTALAATEPPDASPVATPVATPAPVINMSEMTDLSKLPKGLTVISALMGAFLFCFAGGAVIVIRQLRSRRREMLYRHRVEQTEDA